MELNLDPMTDAPVRFPGLILGTSALTNHALKPERPSPIQKLWYVFCE
jgi:hypothetical protein